MAIPKPMQGTDPNVGQNAYNLLIEKEKTAQTKKTPKQKCQEQGGFWDEATQTCLMAPPQQQKQTEKANEPGDTFPKIFTDQQGRPSGITTETGNTYLGMKPQEVEAYAQAQLAQRPGQATQTLMGEQQARQQQAQAMQALQQLGLTPEQVNLARQQAGEAPIDWGQALTAGLANVAPSTVGGAVGGTAIGAIAGGVGAVPGAIIGGVGGFLTGFLNGVRSNIKSQQSGEIASTQKVLTNAKSNLRQIRMLAQADPSRADEAVELYNQQMALVYQAQQKLKLETQGNLNAFMEDGTEKLVEFDLFLQAGGYADLQRQRLQEALAGGVALSPEQIIMQLQEDMAAGVEE